MQKLKEEEAKQIESSVYVLKFNDIELLLTVRGGVKIISPCATGSRTILYPCYDMLLPLILELLTKYSTQCCAYCGYQA